MKEVLLSIQPQWVEKILNGKKTIEIRKTKPNCELPCKVYIYCSKPKHHYFIGRMGFSCDEVFRLPNGTIKFGDSCELMCYESETYTKDNFLSGKVVAEFTLNKIEEIDTFLIPMFNSEKACLTIDQLEEYSKHYFNKEKTHYATKNIYAWHIDNVIIYDKPKELGEFKKPCISPKMSYCPYCPVGTEYISESEAEAFRAFGSCDTEWRCLNFIKKAPQNWCYVEVEK